ncbi:MAG: hypothetical protein IOC86_15620 [Aestuariivirga sp.]|nr:hypothetical protein [Aestuariivirga sp.]
MLWNLARQSTGPEQRSGLTPGELGLRYREAIAYLAELTGFPVTRYDDQVDSTSQFINWAEERFRILRLNAIPASLETPDPWLV